MLARVHGMIHSVLEGSCLGNIGWMPAHLVEADLQHGMARKSDGSLVDLTDLGANDLADTLAKKGVEQHRVPASEVSEWKACFAKTKKRLI